MPKIFSMEIEDHSKEVLKAMKEQALKGLEAIGAEAEGYAKDECPVDTGLLRNSITWAMAGESPKVKSYASDDGSKHGSYSGSAPKDNNPTVYIGTNVEYAPYVEYRSASHQTGKAHFLRDAATTHGEHYKAIMKAALDA